MILAWTMACAATLVLLLAAIGLLRLPGALARQHAATKAATLAISLLLGALTVQVISADWGSGWLLRIGLLLLILLVTLPLAAHALGQSGAAETRKR